MISIPKHDSVHAIVSPKLRVSMQEALDDGWPEPLLAGGIPDLQLDRLAPHVHHLAAKLHADRVVRVLLDCNTQQLQ